MSRKSIHNLKAQYIITPYCIGKFEQGLTRLVEKYGGILNSTTISRGLPQNQMALLYNSLADYVYQTIEKGKIPVSIAGDCLSSIGVLAGLHKAKVYPEIIWLDAHADFHTWETTESNFLGGMPLAMITGRGEQTIVESAGLEPILDRKVSLLYAKDLEESEAEALSQSEINYFSDISKFKTPTRPFYVHFDVDIIAPKYAPAMDHPAREGLSPQLITDFFQKIASEGDIAAISVSSWDVNKDVDKKTEEACLELLKALTG